MKSKPRIYKELIAPNGKKSNLTPEQYKLVRSKAFKDWFGDWENDPENASKVVDENGEPLVVYHTTFSNEGFFSKFNIITISDVYEDELGAHFGTLEQAKKIIDFEKNAKLYGIVTNRKGENPITKPFFLNLKSPMFLEDTKYWDNERFVKNIVENKERVFHLQRDSKDYQSWKNKFHYWWEDADRKSLQENINTLIEIGFDGIMYENRYEGGGLSYATFRQSDIKLADGTNTTFDSSNPDIRFNNGGSINQAQSDLDTKYKLLIETFRSKGYDITEGDNSKTNFGHSRYFYVNFENRLADNFGKGLKARVSDHSVSNTHRLLNEFHFGNSKNINSLEKENVARIEYSLRPEKFTIVPHKTEWEEEYVVGGNEVKPTDTILESLGKSKRGLEKFRIKRKKYAITTYIEDKETKKQYRYENGGEMKSMKHGTITQGKMEGKMAEGGLVAPNGKKSNLTPEQYKLVRSKAFKDWFGDWENDPANASKVVDENGEPMVVYHGTRTRGEQGIFSIFDIERGGESNTLAKVGFWFTPIQTFAKNFADNSYWGKEKTFVYAVFIKIKNPKVYTTDDSNYGDSYEKFRTSVYAIDGQSQERANVGGIESALKNPKETLNKFRESLYSNGFDGIFIKNTRFDRGEAGGNNDQYVVLFPEQIKLANGANTTFDGSNPDIRFDEGGEVNKSVLKDLSSTVEAYQSNHYGSFNRDKLVEIYMSLPISVKLKIQPQSTKNLFRGADGFDSKKSAISFTKNKDYAKFFGTYTIPFSVVEKHEGLIDTRKLSNYLYDLGIQNEIGDDEGEVIVIKPIFKKDLQAKIENYRFNNGGEMKSMKHGTITEGASHDDGGIKVLNKSTNQILEVEGGEGVVNKHSMASDKKVKLNGKEMTICEAVSQLNQMDGNGVKFDCDKVEHRQFIEKMDLGGELEKGIRTEQEHIQTLKELYSKQITPEQASEKIAKEHLAENPAYYSKLQAIEQSKKNNTDLIMKLGGMTNEHIYTFEDFGLIKDFKENPFHKLAEMLKKSNNFCDVEPKYCVTSLDIDRKDMPQVYEEFIPDYVDFLEKQGIDSQMKYNVQVSDLKPTQKNISVERISKILHRLLSGYYTGENGQLLNPLKRVVIATKDGYLLDGHHRWATSLFLSPKNTITVLEINADIADLIPITKGFKKTEYQEFMFGGRVEVLNESSSAPEAVKTLTAYRGGFPQKGLAVSPLLVYSRSLRSYKFVEDAFMIEIPSRNLENYIRASTLNLAKKLSNNLEQISGRLFTAKGLGNNHYERLCLGIADYNFFRENEVGTISVMKKSGTRAIFFVPSKSELHLLNDDTFLEHFLQALNLVTKTPNAPVKVPQPKTKKTSVQSINAPKKQQTIDPSTIVKFDTEKFDNQIIAIQNLMESFTEDEIEARRYLQNEIDKLRGEKEKKLNESLFTTNFTGLLDLYASKVSLQQLPLKKNPCNLTTLSGAPSELDMLQYSIVRTPAFKNWFGDWEEAFKSKNYNGVSKAINERTGEPLVMYHGKSFMKTEMTSFSTPINVNFPIKYFAEESNYSAYFADLDSSKQSLSAIFEFFIRCVNPMDFTSIGTETITPEIFRKVVEAIYGYEIKSPMIMEGVPQKVWQILRGNVPMLNEIRQNTNFDGFKLYEDNPDAPNKGFAEKTLDFAVYSNTAMKAADGRNTTFLKDVESFRFEQGGLVNN
jgi:hypothetical protein